MEHTVLPVIFGYFSKFSESN